MTYSFHDDIIFVWFQSCVSVWTDIQFFGKRYLYIDPITLFDAFIIFICLYYYVTTKKCPVSVGGPGGIWLKDSLIACASWLGFFLCKGKLFQKVHIMKCSSGGNQVNKWHFNSCLFHIDIYNSVTTYSYPYLIDRRTI